VLDGARGHKESEHERHVCPLQIELIRRLIKLYSNPASVQPDVLVMDPFMGIGSTAHVAIELGRNVVGFELKESYHAGALDNVRRALAGVEQGKAQQSLFGEAA
jgi:DNA modification methylase